MLCNKDNLSYEDEYNDPCCGCSEPNDNECEACFL